MKFFNISFRMTKNNIIENVEKNQKRGREKSYFFFLQNMLSSIIFYTGFFNQN